MTTTASEPKSKDTITCVDIQGMSACHKVSQSITTLKFPISRLENHGIVLVVLKVSVPKGSCFME